MEITDTFPSQPWAGSGHSRRGRWGLVAATVPAPGGSSGQTGPVPDAALPADAVPAGTDAAPVVDQRARILDSALHLMAEGGLHGTSMRRLAAEVGLNVATLYHYFPSKAELFAAAVAHQHMDLLLSEPPPVDLGREPADRLADLLVWLFTQIHERGEHIWRLLLGESLRGEPVVVAAAAELSATFEAGLGAWSAEALADVDLDRGALARTLRAAVYGVIVESLLAPDSWERLARERSADLARSLLGR